MEQLGINKTMLYFAIGAAIAYMLYMNRSKFMN